MGKRKTVTLIDDLDGTEADETVEFGIDGRVYSIELSAENAEALRRTVRRWGSHDRQVDRRPRHISRVDPFRAHVSSRERDQIRQWCEHNGYRLGSRGPIPFRVVDAYRSSNS